MTEIPKPKWMEGFTPIPVGKNGRWEKGMKSPNPLGRPRGIIDKRQKLQNAFSGDGPAIARVVIDAALDGDMQACNIALARIAPTLKPQAERVAFNLYPTLPIPEQIETVITAVASGVLAPDIAQTIISTLGTLADARAVAELEERIVKLEGSDQP